MDSKGQTAIEYLLIVVIAISTILVIMIWMQSSNTQVQNATANKVNYMLCDITDCDDPTDCDSAPCPSSGATCGQDGTCEPPI